MKHFSSISILGIAALILTSGCASEHMNVQQYQTAIPYAAAGPVQMSQPTPASLQTAPVGAPQPNQAPVAMNTANSAPTVNCSVAVPVSLLTYSDKTVRKGFWSIPREKIIIQQQGSQQWQQSCQPVYGIQGAVGYNTPQACGQSGFYSPTAMQGGYGYVGGGVSAGGGYGYAR